MISLVWYIVVKFHVPILLGCVGVRRLFGYRGSLWLILSHVILLGAPPLDQLFVEVVIAGVIVHNPPGRGLACQALPVCHPKSLPSPMAGTQGLISRRQVDSLPTVISEADALSMLQLNDVAVDGECDTEFENELNFFKLVYMYSSQFYSWLLLVSFVRKNLLLTLDIKSSQQDKDTQYKFLLLIYWITIVWYNVHNCFDQY